MGLWRATGGCRRVKDKAAAVIDYNRLHRGRKMGGSAGLRYVAAPPTRGVTFTHRLLFSGIHRRPAWSLCTLPPSTCPHLSPGPANALPPTRASRHPFIPLSPSTRERERPPASKRPPVDYGRSLVIDNVMSVARRKSIFASKSVAVRFIANLLIFQPSTIWSVYLRMRAVAAAAASSQTLSTYASKATSRPLFISRCRCSRPSATSAFSMDRSF